MKMLPGSDVKGKILYVGTSYYNNWYLSKALQKIGWDAQTLACSGEGAQLFLHDNDFYLEEFEYWDFQHPKCAFDFLEKILKKTLVADGADVSRALSAKEKVGLWLMFYCLKPHPDAVVAFIRHTLKKTKDPKPEVTKEPVARHHPLWKRVLIRAYLSMKRLSRRFKKPHKSIYRKRLMNFLWRDVDSAGLETIFLEQAHKNPVFLQGLLRCFLYSCRQTQLDELMPLIEKVLQSDVLHFSGVNSLRIFYFFNPHLFGSMPIGWDIQLLKMLGKKIVYSNTGCLDGVSQSAFRRWGGDPVCDICIWRNRDDVCSNERNLAWGKLRNSLADFQVILGGNRVDYNDTPSVHEVPQFYCLEPGVWRPDLPIPEKYQLAHPPGTVNIYHAVGNYDLRTDADNQQNIKCTHIYIPLIQRFKDEGYPVELIFAKDIPNKEVRFYQAQADIVVDMLTFGFFGANVREAMMLGKPAVCYLRPAWLDSMRLEVPDYVAELPVVNATPDTIYDVLKDLIEHPEKREEIGRRSRAFALKWHASNVGATRFDTIYSQLLAEP